MIKTKQQILNEGRYDSFTREISNDIMAFIKETSGKIGESYTILPSEEEDYQHESGIVFTLHLNVFRTGDLKLRGKNYPFFVNTFIDYDDEVYMEISLNMNSEPQSYEKLFYKINEDIRHELEHYTQDIHVDKPRKEMASAEYDTTFKHHMDPSEVEALVHGFYRRAKLEKQPLDVIMKQDLESDISNGNLTQREADILLDKWIKIARRRLPHAIYSNQ